MDSPDEQLLKQTIERLTQENAKLRSQLAVTEQWHPPLDLEHAFRTAKGWECVMVPLIPERPTLILISGTEKPDAAAAGEVWRHLQTAAPPRGRIGPFARARMPGRLLGYLHEHDDRVIIVLNRELRRGQVSRAARMLRSHARTRHPRLLELSILPLLSLHALQQGGSAKSLVGLSAAMVPAATLVLSVAITPSTSVYPETQPPEQVRPTSNVTQRDDKTARRNPDRHRETAGAESRSSLASSETSARAPGSAPPTPCPTPSIPLDRLPIPTPAPTPSMSPSVPRPPAPR
ncbi:hypothetical protein ACN3XK_24880 [Actinomadura welshii]